jgi:hypothetical protein
MSKEVGDHKSPISNGLFLLLPIQWAGAFGFPENQPNNIATERIFSMHHLIKTQKPLEINTSFVVKISRKIVSFYDRVLEPQCNCWKVKNSNGGGEGAPGASTRNL